jgi:uncharacterized protein (DUF486 family)
MACGAGLLMAFAWIGHLKFKGLSFVAAFCMSCLFVLPEYVLNVFSARWGLGVFTGAQVAAMHLAAGIVAVALVSRLYLGETLSPSQLAGFGLMLVSVALIVLKP